jgi:hypothetical protein
MKTDSLFYKLFQQAPQQVLELTGKEQANEENRPFRPKLIKQTAIRLDSVSVHACVLSSPIILLPLMLMLMPGLSWAFASLVGVYLCDLSQVIGMVTTAALFTAPIFRKNQ